MVQALAGSRVEDKSVKERGSEGAREEGVGNMRALIRETNPADRRSVGTELGPASAWPII